MSGIDELDALSKYMGVYVKKPVVVKAVLYDGSDDCLVALNSDAFGYHSIITDAEDNLLIDTLEGVMKASKGDYVIKGVSGEFYPCKPDIFHKTYDMAPC